MSAMLCCLVYAKAEETSFTIEFGTCTADDNNEVSPANLKAFVSAGGEYVASFTDISKVYRGKSGAKMASSKAEGTFTLNFSNEGKKKLTRIVVHALPFPGKSNCTLKVSNATSTNPLTFSEEQDLEFTFESSTPYSLLMFTASSGKQIYIKSITCYYEADGPVLEQSATPSISGETSFTESAEVTITAAEGAAIYYTLDGSTPTTSSTAYNAPFTITATTTVKAIALENGKNPSEVAEATFIKKPAVGNAYQLVTSADQLDEASSYIIGIGEQNKAMSNAQADKFIVQTTATIIDGSLVPADDVMTFKLIKGTGPDADKWAFKADNYKGTGEYLQNSTTTNTVPGSSPYYFPVTFDGGNVIIKSSGGRWIHGYNGQDFRNYNTNASNSCEVQLYRLGVNVLPAPGITLSNDKAYVGDKVTVSIDKKNVENVYYTIDGTEPTSTNGTLYIAPFEVTAQAAGEVTVKAIGVDSEGETSQASSATITFIEPAAEGSWARVESAADLQVNARYVLAYNGKAVSNAAVVNNKLQSTDASVDADGILTLTDDMMIFTLGNGTAEGKYTLKSSNYNPTNATGDYYLTITSGTSTNVGMKKDPCDLYLTYTEGSADVSIQYSTSDNRILMGNTTTPVIFGYYATSNSSYPRVQLYKEVIRTVPGIPTVTYTATAEGDNLEITDEGTYTAVNSTKIIITSANATEIKVNGTSYTAENGIYSFTADVDGIYEVSGKNAAGESSSVMFEINVDYEAVSVSEIHTLSKKQKDRTNTSNWAPVKLTGWVFIRGHYVEDDTVEELWVEDEDGTWGLIFAPDGEFNTPAHPIENNIMLRNFTVRSNTIPAAAYDGMEMISFSQDVEHDVQSHNNWYIPETDAENADASNVYKLQRFHGNITFTANGGEMTLTNSNVVEIANKLTLKSRNGGNNTSARYEGESFNWIPGGEWPAAGTTMQNIYLAGFVMPKGGTSEETPSFVVYPGQVAENLGDLTGAAAVENDMNVIIEEGGVIKAPAGSRIYSLDGKSVMAGQSVNNGVYVVVLRGGKAVKILVK